MYPELMKYLACPVDHHSPLSLDAKKVSGDGEIQTGTIHCQACGKAFEVRESIPCFVSDSDEKGAHGDEAERWKSEERAFRDEEPYRNTLPDPVALAEFEGLTTLLQLEKHHTLLDLGCGAGRITELIAEVACTTVAIDFSLGSLKVFRKRIPPDKRGRIHLVQADVFHLPLRSQVFHRIVSNGVFEHLPRLLETKLPVLEAARVLLDGGVFVLSIYNYSGPRTYIAKLFPAVTYGGGYEQEGFHAGKIYFRRYQWKEIEELLTVGFEVEHIGGMRIVPSAVLKRGGRLASSLESALQHSALSRWLGYYLLASGRKKAQA